jgi:hypothetical protein
MSDSMFNGPATLGVAPRDADLLVEVEGIALPAAPPIGDESRYEAYRSWCESQLGIPAAPYRQWRKTNKRVAECNYADPMM